MKINKNIQQTAGYESRRKLGVTLAAAATLASLLGPAAMADTSTNTAGPVQQGQSDGGSGNPALNNSAETISLSGAAALRAFTTSPGLTLLSPGTSITLHNGTNGAPVTYYSPSSSTTSVQLASNNFTSIDTGVGATSFDNAATNQNHSALRIEWHDTGSVEGIIDLVNDQIGYAGGISGTSIQNLNNRAPTTANPIWVNTNRFQTGGTINGFGLNGAVVYNTYDPTNYNLATGQNLLHGQNRVQIGIGEQVVQEFSVNGASSVFATPGTAGYGKGNSFLASGSTLNGLGVAGSRQQLTPQEVTNMPTTNIDPQTGAHYAAGAWNTAGINNLRAERVAVTATTFVANPGTGLYRINKGDAQWLQTTSRLANGATFNFSERDVNAGQRNITALNTGIDPSFAVGLNDGGDSNPSANTVPQHSIGSSLRFSGKSSGTEVRTTVAQNRMGGGIVAISEVRGAASNAPVRSLDVYFNGTTDPTVGGVTDPSQFVRLNFDTLVSGQYLAFQNEHYVTVRAPDAHYNDATPTIKGDTTGDVRAFINNITGTVSAFPNLSASVANPADALLNAGFMLPNLMSVQRDVDGGPLYSNNLTADQQALQQAIRAAYGSKFTADGTAGANNVTTGVGSTYGALGASGTINGAIPITANNFLFGNFNQNGTRDFSAVKESVNAALSLHHVDGGNSDIFSGVVNSTPVPSLSGSGAWAAPGAANTKGDLIVLGDYNGDGAFDGKDVLALARGAALADHAATDHLTTASGPTFADQLRNPNAVLRKNAALNYVRSQTSSATDADQIFLRRTAESPQAQANDAANNYQNAFNKLDVDHNGKFDRNDAAIVDKFNGRDYARLIDQVTAAINDPYSTNNQAVTSGTQVSFNLVDANLTDGKTAIDRSDFNQVRVALGSGLIDGDANFDGKVNAADFVLLSNNFGGHTSRFGLGDFNGDGVVNAADFVLLSNHFGQGGTLTATELARFNAIGSLAGLSVDQIKHLDSEITVAVPEPGTLGLMGFAMVGLLRRRRQPH